MNANETVLGQEIAKRYPSKGSLQRVRLASPAEFTCSRCLGTKKARLVAFDGEALFCNGCYGRMNTGQADVERPRPAGPQAPDPAQAVVKQDGWGRPYGITASELTVEWSVTVRAENLLGGTCPVPDEAVSRIPDSPLNLAFIHRKRSERDAFDYQHGISLGQGGTRPMLTGVRWHPSILPGTRLRVCWKERLKSRLSLTCTVLRPPVVVAGTVVLYEYDPRVMTRDLAAADLRADQPEEIVLITLRELGYLDEYGRALLPRPALVRNAGEHAGAGPKRPTAQELDAAIEYLLSRGLLTWETGSINSRGVLTYPARSGGTPVDLLCYAPNVRDAKETDVRAAEGQEGVREVEAHQVAGHLMRIGHLGKKASPAAEAAYVYDRKRAGLAGPHRLPPNYTYVREHERGV
ncbi:hypothetical protein [Streptomyces sp. NPDC007346]|uniref:hypothetical protein n=1 Tax=Streptomyces sp. NPDC007346 TaxID=3154682 RepID=UPI00345385B9